MVGTSRCRCGRHAPGSGFRSFRCRTAGASPAIRKSPAPYGGPSKPPSGSLPHLPGSPVSHAPRGTSAMTQNIYDDEEFFQGYSRLRRSVEGLDGAPEWPALRSLLPNLSGLKVLDLGCGFGWFCRWARQQGAAYVLGIDVSEKMLARARGEADDPAITYRNADMEKLDLPANSFNLVYSSLALHYVGNLNGLMLQVDRSLLRGASDFHRPI